METDSLRFALALVLLTTSAFFSGSETALFSLTRSKISELETKGGRAVQKIRYLLANPRHTLVSILTGNELVNVAFSAVMAGITWHFGLGHTASIALTTLLVLLFGEITPKSIALTFPAGYAKVVSGPLLVWYRLITPVRIVLQKIANFFSGLGAGKPEDDSYKLDEEAVLHLIEEGKKVGVIEEIEGDLIKRMLDLDDVLIKDIMTPKDKIFSLPKDLDLPEILKKLKENRFSRIPVVNDSGEFVGIFLAREILPYIKRPQDFPGLDKLMRPPFFVPSRKRAYDLLREFRLKKIHMALVVDEYGKVVGLVTLDDILAALFGMTDLPRNQENAE